MHHNTHKTHKLVKNTNQWRTQKKPQAAKRRHANAQKFNSHDFILSSSGKSFDQFSPVDKLIFILALSSSIGLAFAAKQPTTDKLDQSSLNAAHTLHSG